jgi:hypothetical protein
VLLRKLRFLGIKTCEPTEELGRWLYVPRWQQGLSPNGRWQGELHQDSFMTSFTKIKPPRQRNSLTHSLPLRSRQKATWKSTGVKMRERVKIHHKKYPTHFNKSETLIIQYQLVRQHANQARNWRLGALLLPFKAEHSTISPTQTFSHLHLLTCYRCLRPALSCSAVFTNPYSTNKSQLYNYVFHP